MSETTSKTTRNTPKKCVHSTNFNQRERYIDRERDINTKLTTNLSQGNAVLRVVRPWCDEEKKYL